MLISLAAARIRKKLASTSDAIALAEKLAGEGHRVDLAGLDDEIEQICEDFLALEKWEVIDTVGALEQLQRELEFLRQKIAA